MTWTLLLQSVTMPSCSRALVAENFRQSGPTPHLQQPVDVGRSHIAVDQQYPLAGSSGDADGQLDGDAGLSLRCWKRW